MQKPQLPATHSLTAFFLIAFAFSWLFWLVPVLSSSGFFSLAIPNMAWVIVGAHGPLVAALILVYRSAGWGAVKQLIRSGFNLRMSAVWWLFILFVPVVLAGLAVWLNIILTDYQPDTTLLEQPLMILPTFLVLFFLGGAFQEEFGWRGYALPGLLEKWNPLLASVFLGVIWGVWHLPLFYIADASQSFMPFGVFVLLAVGFSIVFTWLWIRTNRNLFSALLFHAAINTSFSLFPPVELQAGGNQQAFTYLMGAYFILAIVLVVRELDFWKQKVTSR